MKMETFCQSCSMPLNQPESFGTEMDGSKNSLYCNFCYQKGSFTNKTITLEGMKKLVTDQMHKMKMDESLINRTMDILPSLKRWKNQNVTT